MIHISGMLQIEDRVRAAFAYVNPDLPTTDLESEVAHRMRRREVIERDSPPAFEAVIHEAALRIKVGGAKVSRAQLVYIMDIAERENVTIRVIPFDVDDFAGAGYSMLYAGGPVPQLDTVQVDAAHGSIFLDAGPQLKKYRALFDRIEGSALSAVESREFIERIARDI